MGGVHYLPRDRVEHEVLRYYLFWIEGMRKKTNYILTNCFDSIFYAGIRKKGRCREHA